jgi:hypothetical protein
MCLCELSTDIFIYMLETFMSRALLLVHKDGSFVFSKDTHLRDIQNDDMLFNWTIQDTMTMLSGGLPFRIRHEIHLDISQLFFPTLSCLGSLVVDINVSISLFQFPLHSTLSNFISLFALLHLFHLVLQISLRGFP